MHNIKVRNRFLDDIKDHQMQIIKDDGLHRHIRFQQPGTSCYYFDIITWPDYLAITGDMGHYMFTRIEDMFDFFPMDKRDWNSEEDGLGINPSYWAEKLRARCSRGELTVFSEEKLKEAIKSHYDGYLEWNDVSKEDQKELWQRLESEVLGAYSIEEAYRLASDFEYEDFRLEDFWGHTITEYNTIYIRCCYAIVWGIGKYNKSKETKKAA